MQNYDILHRLRHQWCVSRQHGTPWRSSTFTRFDRAIPCTMHVTDTANINFIIFLRFFVSETMAAHGSPKTWTISISIDGQSQQSKRFSLEVRAHLPAIVPVVKMRWFDRTRQSYTHKSIKFYRRQPNFADQWSLISFDFSFRLFTWSKPLYVDRTTECDSTIDAQTTCRRSISPDCVPIMINEIFIWKKKMWRK